MWLVVSMRLGVSVISISRLQALSWLASESLGFSCLPPGLNPCEGRRSPSTGEGDLYTEGRPCLWPITFLLLCPGQKDPSF